MSHVTTIKSVPIKDIAALRQAVERLKSRGVNCTLEENAVPRMYYRHQEHKCDFVLRLPNSRYDVGFEKQKDGSYTAAFDEWDNQVGKNLQVKACPMPGTQEERSLKSIGMLSQEYARCSAVNAAAASGYYVESESLDEKTGEYQLQFTDGS